MKSPMNQRPDDEAREATEAFIARYAGKGPGTTAKGGARARVRADDLLDRAPRRHGERPAPAGRSMLPPVSRRPLRIAQVTPYPWEDEHEVNTYVARVAEELAARGHRAARRRAVALAGRSCATRGGCARAARARAGGARRGPGARASARRCRRCRARRRAALPIDVARTIADLFETAPRSTSCHVHEPFAPSVASAALRHSRALNVGTFHAPTERVVSTQVARRVVELFFGRLDARTASFAATRELMHALLPRPTTASSRPAPTALERRAHGAGAPLRIAFVEEEERAAAAAVPARAAPPGPRARLGGGRRLAPADRRSAAPLRADLRERVRFAGRERGRTRCSRGADVVVAASDGAAPAPGRARARARPRAPCRSPRACRSTRRSLRDGDRRAAVRAARRRDARGAARAPGRRRRQLRERLRAASAAAAVERGGRRARGALRRARRRAATTAAAIPPRAGAWRGRRLHRRRPAHAHRPLATTARRRSRCCWPAARDQGLGAIAVTDHNEISGALEARGQGRRLRRQGDRRRGGQDRQPGRGDRALHRGEDPARDDARTRRSPRSAARAASSTCPTRSTACTRCPTTSTCSTSSSDVDAIEVFNPRVAIGVVQRGGGALRRQVPDPGRRGLRRPRRRRGSARCGSGCATSTGPQEFLESLRDADIVTQARRACSTCRR